MPIVATHVRYMAAKGHVSSADKKKSPQVIEPAGLSTKKADYVIRSPLLLVLPLGLEPRTPTLRVSCSTN